jgi:hypothetical protein
MEYITDLIDFFFLILQPAHLLCILHGVLKLGFPCLLQYTNLPKGGSFIFSAN